MRKARRNVTSEDSREHVICEHVIREHFIREHVIREHFIREHVIRDTRYVTRDMTAERFERWIDKRFVTTRHVQVPSTILVHRHGPTPLRRL